MWMRMQSMPGAAADAAAARRFIRHYILYTNVVAFRFARRWLAEKIPRRARRCAVHRGAQLVAAGSCAPVGGASPSGGTAAGSRTASPGRWQRPTAGTSEPRRYTASRRSLGRSRVPQTAVMSMNFFINDKNMPNKMATFDWVSGLCKC